MIARALPLAGAALAVGCMNLDTPSTNVIFDNEYPATASADVLYEAYWSNVTFSGPDSGVAPLSPGESSDAVTAVPASDNTAYAVLAPGWDPDASAAPTTFVVLQSRDGGFAVRLGDTLHIPVNDTTFAGNCATGPALLQSQADFITQIVFPSTFAGKRYDAASCTTTPIGDAGSE
jgi:hypothetical protein